MSLAGHGTGLNSLIPPTAARLKLVTVIAVVVAAGYLVTCLVGLVLLAMDYSLVNSITSNNLTQVAADADSLGSVEKTVNGLNQAGLIGYLIAYLVWWTTARRIARTHGEAGKVALRHWTLRAWQVGILVSLIVSFTVLTELPDRFADLADARDTLLEHDRNAIFFLILRVVVVSLFIAAVVTISKRVLGLIPEAVASHQWTPRSWPPVSEAAGVDVGDHVDDQDRPRA
jgi:hypothetical protein